MVKKNTSNQSIDKLPSIVETMAHVSSPMRLSDIAENQEMLISVVQSIINKL